MMVEKQKPKGYWTQERVCEEALKYDTRTAWQKKSSGSYDAARDNGWLDICTKHMKMKRRVFKEEQLMVVAQKYETRMGFSAGSPHEYQAAYRTGILDKCCAHMEVLSKRWSISELKETAKQYATPSAFEKANPKAYNTILRRRLTDECFAHMKRINVAKGYWTLERCRAMAAAYTRRVDWQKGHPASYQAAGKKGWIDVCAAHMELVRETWTLARAVAEAQKYSTRSDFIRGCGSAYNLVKAHGQLEIACKHMRTVIEKSDSVYVWKAVGETYHGKSVYKVGVARAIAKLDRIQRCAQKNGMQFELLTMRQVGKQKAKKLEKYLLTFGENPKLSVREGKTEFRALTDEQVSTIIKVIESHPIL